MLKKAGIVVAASAASLLAVSPMAFAAGGDHDKGGHSSEDSINKSADGLVSGLNGNNVNVPVQACNNNVPVNVLGVQVPVEDAAAGNGLTGALGVLGEGAAQSGDSVTDQSDNCGQQSGSGDTVSN